MKKWEDYDVLELPNGKKIDMLKLLDDQNRAKAILLHLAPVLGGFIGKLRFVYTFQVETQATDGYNILVNPEFTSELNITQKAFVMAHEIMHCLLNHLRRAKVAGHDPEKSNIAADYECNITLVDMDLFDINTIKEIGGLVDKKYSGWGYEAIYDSNPQMPSNNSSMQNQPPKGSSGSGSSGGKSSGSKSSKGKQSNSSNNDGDGPDGSEATSGNGGSGSSAGSGDNGDSRDKKGSDGKVGKVSESDYNGPSALSKIPAAAGGIIDKDTGDKIAKSEGYPEEGGSEAAIEREWKDAAIKASQKLQGKQAGALKSKIESIYKTSTDWKKALRNIVGHSISPEEKRQAYANKNTLVAQNRIARTDKDKYDNMDYMMCWIDSSGSMTDDMLRRVLAEVYTVALAKKPIQLWIVQCDTTIQDIEVYRNVRELKSKLTRATVKGRGGTELKPCWDLLKKDPRFRSVRPDLIMIFTDGYLTQYKRDPRSMKNLCWVILDNPGFNLQYKDPFTKCIYLNTNDIK